MKLAELFYAIVLGCLIGNPGAVAQDRGTAASAPKGFEDLLRERQFEAANELALKNLDAMETKLGSDHPDMATQLETYAKAFAASEAYDQGESHYNRAFAIREKQLGSDNPELAKHIESLAAFYKASAFKTMWGGERFQKARDQTLRAEVLYKRALTIRVKALGESHPDLVSILNRLAYVYVDLDRPADAALCLERSLKIAESAFGVKHPAFAKQLISLALFKASSNSTAAELLYQRALAINEELFGVDHLDVADILMQLGFFYKNQDLSIRAEPYFVRALAIRERALGEEDGRTTEAMNQLALMYSRQGLYDKAEPLFRHVLAVSKKTFALDSLEVAMAMQSLGMNYEHQGRYELAIPLYEHALKILAKVFDSDPLVLNRILLPLADIYYRLGMHAKAAPLYQTALNINKGNNSERTFHHALYSSEQAHGLEDERVAWVLSLFAEHYNSRRQLAQAEPLLRRVLAIREKMNGPKSLQVARAMNNLAGHYMNLGQYAQAEPLFERSLAIKEITLGPDDLDVALALNNLAALYSHTSRRSLARPLTVRSFAIHEKNLGPDHPEMVLQLQNLAIDSPDREAESLIKRAVAIREKGYGPDSVPTTLVLPDLVSLQMRQGHHLEALTNSQKIFKSQRAYLSQGAEPDAFKLNSKTEWRPNFLTHVALLLDHGQQSPDWRSDAFEATQLARESSVGQSIAQMAARLAKADAELGQLIRRQQDKALLLKQANDALAESIGQAPTRRDSKQEEALRGTISVLEYELADSRGEISKRFPHYDSLVSLAPVPLGEAQSLLAPDEALIYYLAGYNESVTKLDSLRRVYAWVLRKDGVQFIRVAMTAEELDTQVGTLRSRLDLEQNIELKPFDLAASHELYKKIFAPLESALVGVKHVIVVPDGPLQSLPLSVLVDRKPKKKGKPSWLIDRYALSTVPSVAALRALRAADRRAVGDTTSFIGFGDPVLNGTPANHRSLAVRGLYGAGTESKSEKLSIADVGAIRQIVALPDTADELRALAKTLSAPADNLYLGMRATETAVKNADLSNVSILAFATHGVVAGELTGITEPGLILTPPEKGTEMDDGYLSASEVVQLKLNADLVLLSACNTAAPDGKPGAEGLSGLAKAFFYAGARSLLVSNWVVVSHASTRLTTGMLKHYSDNGKSGRAEALRQSILDLKRNPAYAHPLYWAPFVVVGEGRIR